MLDNFKIAKAMKVIKKECVGTDEQCDMECCLYDDIRHICKLATSIKGEPRDCSRCRCKAIAYTINS